MRFPSLSNGHYTIPSDNRELQLAYCTFAILVNYTIPSDNRELQPIVQYYHPKNNYTIPSDNRELQLPFISGCKTVNYTIPSDNRELQLLATAPVLFGIIPYQVITGNYNHDIAVVKSK